MSTATQPRPWWRTAANPPCAPWCDGQLYELPVGPLVITTARWLDVQHDNGVQEGREGHRLHVV